MWHEVRLNEEFFARLERQDAAITAQVAARGCVHCGGPLHRGDYDRKPRGGLFAEAGEKFCRRYSLCCGRRGCRRRTTPVSLRFLGRKVYLELVVVLASLCGDMQARTCAQRAETGVPTRTVRRWLGWWRGEVATGLWWLQIQGLFVPPVPEGSRLPGSLIERLRDVAGSIQATLAAVTQWLTPLTSRSCPDSSRFVRGSWFSGAHAEDGITIGG